MSYVYFILDKISGAMKIGKANNVLERLSTLQTGNPNPLKIVKTIECNSEQLSFLEERRFHNKFEHLHLNGEWFKYDDKLFDEVLNQEVIEKKVSNKNLITVNTLFGQKEFFRFASIPSCHFYPHLTAQIKDNYESAAFLTIPFRTMEYPTDGKSLLLPYSDKKNRVFISTKKHQENLDLNRFLKTKKEKIESESLERFYAND